MRQSDPGQHLVTLGIAPAEIQAIIAQHAPDWDAGTAALHNLIKARRKHLQITAHPDRGGSIERSAAINAAADELLRHVRVGPPPAPPPMAFHIVIVRAGSTWTSSTTNSGYWRY